MFIMGIDNLFDKLKGNEDEVELSPKGELKSDKTRRRRKRTEKKSDDGQEKEENDQQFHDIFDNSQSDYKKDKASDQDRENRSKSSSEGELHSKMNKLIEQNKKIIRLLKGDEAENPEEMVWK